VRRVDPPGRLQHRIKLTETQEGGGEAQNQQNEYDGT